MVNEKIIEIWKKKAQEGDVLAQAHLDNLKEVGLETIPLSGQSYKKKIMHYDTKISLRLPQDLFLKLKARASSTNQTINRLLRGIIKECVADSNDKPAEVPGSDVE